MLIQLQNVSLRHDDHPILNGVDFCVDDNDFIYIVGKVGSGKSSLLKAIYGELPITEGKAQVLNYDMTKLKRKHLPLLRRQLGIVFQDFQLLHELTIGQNLDFVLKATGCKRRNALNVSKRFLSVWNFMTSWTVIRMNCLAASNNVFVLLELCSTTPRLC